MDKGIKDRVYLKTHSDVSCSAKHIARQAGVSLEECTEALQELIKEGRVVCFRFLYYRRSGGRRQS